MKTLYLLAAERAYFDALPPALREGWIPEEETLTFEDSAQKQLMRLELLRVHDPKLQNLCDRVRKARSQEEATAMLQAEDLKDVDEDDLAQMFFAMGPVAITELLRTLLSSMRNDEDIERATALTVIRHTILQSYHPASA